MNTLKIRPPLVAVWAIDVREEYISSAYSVRSALYLLMEKVGQLPFALSVDKNWEVDVNKVGDHDLHIQGTPKYTFTAFVYYPHVHIWRLGTLHEFPKGYVGCACGVLKPFDLFEKEDTDGTDSI